MKRGLTIALTILISLLAMSIFSNAEVEDCEYDPKFDNDKDFIMSNGADCGQDYEYDCDDNDKDLFKDCRSSLWSRIVAFFKGDKGQKDRISGNTVKTSIEKSDDCAAVICEKDSNKVYCPESYTVCMKRYSECRIIECDEDYLEEEPEEDYYRYEESGTYYDDEEFPGDDSSCNYEYHDCYDNGEAILCKGSFDACDSSFDDCACGTNDEIEDQAVPDTVTEADFDCETGVFVCNRQVVSMSGDIADSTVTCKGSFSECAMLYGDCQCGDDTLTDFPTQYIGNTDVDSGSENANNYWCDYKDRQIPCYMLPDNCSRKKNTCRKSAGSDSWITCEGSFDYCAKNYPECLCGIETTTSGVMVTSR